MSREILAGGALLAGLSLPPDGNVTITVSGLGRAELKNQDADEDFRRVRRLPKL